MRDSDPGPRHRPAAPAAGRSTRHRAAQGAAARHRQAQPDRRSCWSAWPDGRVRGRDQRPGTARRPALRPRAAGSPAGRRARRGPRLRRPVLRHERHPQHQARRVQAELLAQPRRPRLPDPGGDGMSSGRQEAYLRQVPRHRGQQRRPEAARPDPGRWCPTSSATTRHLGRACVPLAGNRMGLSFVPPVGSGVWVEFEQGDPDYPSGPAAGGVGRRTCRRGRQGAARPTRRSVLQTSRRTRS